MGPDQVIKTDLSICWSRILTILLVQLSNLEGVLALKINVVVIFIPQTRGSELGAWKMRERVEEHAVKVDNKLIDHT